MTDLPPIIRAVDDGLRAIDAALGRYDGSSTWHQRRREQLAHLSAQLTAQHGAKISERWDGARVRMAGISSTSTSGMGGALSNWLAAAWKRLAAD